MDILGAVVAGVMGTVVFSVLMAAGPRMGLPKMAIWEILGSMFDKDGNTGLGWALHFMMGVVFALVYAALWSAGIGSATVAGGLVFGIAHFLIAGAMMGGLPVMHAGVKAGTTQAPGVLMLNAGVMGFMGGLVLHAVYGVTVALFYSIFAG